MNRCLFRSSSAHRSRRTPRDSGFTLVAVMIGIAILTILIAAVAPSIATIMKRDREQELIFRGRQYARAIGLFQRRYGRYPNELKELYENRPRAIRKLWKDPFCNCSFHALVQGMPDAVPSGQGGAPAVTPTPSLFSGGPFGGGGSPTPAPTAGAFGPASGETKTIGPIIGVRSTVHQEALQSGEARSITTSGGSSWAMRTATISVASFRAAACLPGPRSSRPRLPRTETIQ